MGAVTAPPLTLVAVFYLWPVATLLARGVDPTSVADTLASQRTVEVLWFTLWQAVVSTTLTLVFGLPAAWAVSRYQFAGRQLFVSTLTAVFVLPTVVVGAAFVALLPARWEHGAAAIIGAHVVFNLAVVVRTVGAMWSRIPVALEHAGATLGASPLRVFRLITWPLLRPAAAAAAAIVFLFTFTSFGVIRVLGTVSRSTIEVEVWRRATRLGDIGGAAVLSMLQLVVLGTMVWWTTTIQRRHAHRLAAPTSGRIKPRGRARWTVGGVIITTSLLVITPLLALAQRSLQVGDHYSLAAWRNLGNNEIRPGVRLGIDPLDALWQSTLNAALATVFAVAIGGSAVVAISALGRMGKALDTGLMLPLGTSAVTIGFGMLITFDTPPFDWRAEWWLVPVGHALVATPFVVRTTLGVVRALDPDQARAAATLGAPPVRAWAATTLPALRRPLATSAGLAAAISLGEFGATSFLSRTGSETLPIVIDRLLGRTGGSFQAQAFALSVILAVATVTIVILVDLGGDHARHT